MYQFNCSFKLKHSVKLQEENTNTVYVSTMAIIATIAHMLQNTCHIYVQKGLNYLHTQIIYTAAN